VQVPTQLFSSPSLPIDARVSEKLRAKIWNNEFFDFNVLLSNPGLEDRYQVTILNSDKDKIPSLSLEPVAKAKKQLSIETWLSCFHIFVGVYTSRSSHEAPALMKYGEVVQDLAARGGNCKFYDENFRFNGQHNLLHSPGVLFIGNYGCGPNILLKNYQILPVRCVLSPNVRVSLRGIVLSFTGEWIVMLVVPLNIYVTSVKVHM